MNQLTFVAILSIVAVLVFFLHFPIILLLNRPEKEARPGPVSLRGKVKATHTVRYESKTVKDEELSSLIDRFPLSYAKEAEAIRKSTKIHIKVKNGHLSTTESRVESDYEEKDGKPDVARIKRHVNTTLVTALLDIGRGEWEVYQRPLKKYHDFMKNVLSLKVPMVVFVDEKSYAFVIKVRRRMGLSSVTKVWKISMTDLPLFQYHNYVRDIIAYEKQGNGWQEKWDPRMKYHPEASSSEYNIVVNSKPYFLYNTTVENPFSTNFFTWLDAGYGHGDASVFPPHFYWFPTFPRSKISVIKLTPSTNSITKYDLDSLYRINLSVVSGGFLAGDAEAIGNFYPLFQHKIVELLTRNYIDDDQTVLVLVIKDHPSLFELEYGDWFDAFELF